MPPRLHHLAQLLVLERRRPLERHVRDADLRRLLDLERDRAAPRALIDARNRLHLRLGITRLLVKLLNLLRVREELPLIHRLADLRRHLLRQLLLVVLLVPQIQDVRDLRAPLHHVNQADALFAALLRHLDVEEVTRRVKIADVVIHAVAVVILPLIHADVRAHKLLAHRGRTDIADRHARDLERPEAARPLRVRVQGEAAQRRPEHTTEKQPPPSLKHPTECLHH